jgi:signal transduction histidine kinase/PAS domain-containing protein
LFPPSDFEIREIFRSLPGYYLVLTPDLRVVTATDATLKATRTALVQIQGKPFAEAFPGNPATTPEALGRVKEAARCVLETKASCRLADFCFHLPDPDQPGMTRESHWSTVFSPVLDAAGEVKYLLRESIDITENVLAKRQIQVYKDQEQAAALSHLEQRLYRFLTQVPAGISIFNGPDFTYEFANPAYHTIIPGREIIGRPILEVIPELKSHSIITTLLEVHKTGKTAEGREVLIPIIPPGGTIPQDRYFNFVFQARLDEQGQVNGIMNFAYDVTELVQARKQVEQSAVELNQLNKELEVRVAERTRELEISRADAERQRNRMESFFMQAPAAICVYEGPEYTYTFINETYQTLFPGRKLIGLPLFTAIPELRDTVIYDIIGKVYQTGEPYEGREQRVMIQRTPESEPEEMFYNFIYQARHNEAGEIDGVMCFAYEVTAQVKASQSMERNQKELEALTEKLKAANLRLRNAKQNLEETNRELAETNLQLTHTNSDLDTFVYTASHDLKSPIYNLEGLIHELQEELSSGAHEGANHMLEMMESSLIRFRKTIDQLTEISRLQKPGKPDDIAEVMLPVVLEEVRLDLAELIHSTKAKLETDLEQCPGLSFSEKNMRSVLFNLLSNALKYHDPARPLSIRISCETKPGYLLLTMADNGLGLTQSQLEDLFSLFKRFHTHVEGTGVGLYVVKRIIENAGGFIEVESEIGKGTIFKVWFRNDTPATPALQHQSETASMPPRK